MNKDTENIDNSQENRFFSIFKPPISNKKPESKPATIQSVYEKIIGTGLKSMTEAIRRANDEKEKQRLKKLLPFVTFAGVFKLREEKQLLSKSDFIIIDIDHRKDIENIRQAILNEIEPVLMFRSPRGEGIKVVLLINTKGSYKDYFRAFQKFFSAQFSIKIDTHGNDIARACFLCYDPGAYVSQNPTMFDIDFITTMGMDEQSEIFRRGKKWVEKELQFVEGSRHDFITKLASFLNRAGLDKDLALHKLSEYQQAGFDLVEITGIVNRIYEKSEMHGTNRLKIVSKIGSEAYTYFPLKLLWVNKEMFLEGVQSAISGNFQFSPGDIPTNIKTEYLIDTLNGKINPELLLYMAAIKSITGTGKKARNFAKTYKEVVEKRMFNDNPWHNCSKHRFNKLTAEAMRRKFVTYIADYSSRRGFYVSLSYSVEKLEETIIKANIERSARRYESQEKSKQAAKRISEVNKHLKKGNKSPLTNPPTEGKLITANVAFSNGFGKINASNHTNSKTG